MLSSIFSSWRVSSSQKFLVRNFPLDLWPNSSVVSVKAQWSVVKKSLPKSKYVGKAECTRCGLKMYPNVLKLSDLAQSGIRTGSVCFVITRFWSLTRSVSPSQLQPEVRQNLAAPYTKDLPFSVTLPFFRLSRVYGYSRERRPARCPQALHACGCRGSSPPRKR